MGCPANTCPVFVRSVDGSLSAVVDEQDRRIPVREDPVVLHRLQRCALGIGDPALELRDLVNASAGTPTK